MTQIGVSESIRYLVALTRDIAYNPLKVLDTSILFQ